MGTGRWLAPWIVVLAACGGESTTVQSDANGGTGGSGGTQPTDPSCKTSFACPTGQRCDDGACVPDDGCPDARDPELLFEAPAGSPFAADMNPYLTVMDGREYLTESERDEAGRYGELTYFLDLRTGREFHFVHEPGYAGCGGSPARCEFPYADTRAMAEIDIGNDNVGLRDETVFAFSGVRHIIFSDADYRDRRVVVWRLPTLVERYELGSATPMVSVDLDDKSLSTVLVDADGRSERILSWKQENLATGEAAELAVTPLESGASSTPIYQSLGAHGAVLALPDGEDWFVLREGRPAYDEPVVSVYRADGAVTLVGTLDTLWAIGVDYKYRTGERSLEPGPSAYVGHCDQNGCGSYRFFLDPVRLEEVASRALPEPGLRGHYSRRLACGGADFWVVTRDGPEAPMRFWSLRIPGRAGFP